MSDTCGLLVGHSHEMASGHSSLQSRVRATTNVAVVRHITTVHFAQRSPQYPSGRTLAFAGSPTVCAWDAIGLLSLRLCIRGRTVAALEALSVRAWTAASPWDYVLRHCLQGRTVAAPGPSFAVEDTS